MTDRDSAVEAALDAELRREGEMLRAERAGCPPPDLMLARRSEVLDDDVRARLDSHIAGCDACRRMAADVDLLDLGAADGDVETRVAGRVMGSAGPRRTGMLSIAAALLLASGLAVSWWYLRPRAEPPRIVTQPAPQPSVSEPPAVVALWTITASAVRVPLSSLGATRSAEAPPLSSLVEALEPYSSGDYAGSAERLARFVEAQPDSAEAQFYLGVSRLMSEQAHAALSPLERAVRLLPADRRPEAEWYLATAEQRTGRTDAARTRLQALCASTGSYQSRACAAAATLP